MNDRELIRELDAIRVWFDADGMEKCSRLTALAAARLTALEAEAARLKDRLRVTCQALVNAAGADGPMDAEDAADRLVKRYDAANAEVARLRGALEEVLACIKFDPTMDGSIRPRGFTVEIIEAIRTARTALASAR